MARPTLEELISTWTEKNLRWIYEKENLTFPRIVSTLADRNGAPISAQDLANETQKKGNAYGNLQQLQAELASLTARARRDEIVDRKGPFPIS